MSEKVTHTAGPWELCNKGDYGDFDGNSRVILGDDRRLAVVHVSDDETDANARLIAAAPDLLEACKDALDALYHAEDTMEPLRESLRAAISKAEGR